MELGCLVINTNTIRNNKQIKIYGVQQTVILFPWLLKVSGMECFHVVIALKFLGNHFLSGE